MHIRYSAGLKLLGWFSVSFENPSVHLKLRWHHPVPGVFSVQSKKQIPILYPFILAVVIPES